MATPWRTQVISPLRTSTHQYHPCKFEDIIALSEVWNVPNTDIFSLNGYNLEVKCRDGGMRGGGVGAYMYIFVLH